MLQEASLDRIKQITGTRPRISIICKFRKQLFKLLYNETLDYKGHPDLESRIDVLMDAPLIGEPRSRRLRKEHGYLIPNRARMGASWRKWILMNLTLAFQKK